MVVVVVVRWMEVYEISNHTLNRKTNLLQVTMHAFKNKPTLLALKIQIRKTAFSEGLKLSMTHARDKLNRNTVARSENNRTTTSASLAADAATPRHPEGTERNCDGKFV